MTGLEMRSCRHRSYTRRGRDCFRQSAVFVTLARWASAVDGQGLFVETSAARGDILRGCGVGWQSQAGAPRSWNFSPTRAHANATRHLCHVFHSSPCLLAHTRVLRLLRPQITRRGWATCHPASWCRNRANRPN